MARAYLNNRDRVTTTSALATWLRNTGTQVIILDNASTYPPLLEYYRNLPEGVTVQYFGTNAGPWAFWERNLHKQQTEPYVVTDSDMLPDDACPNDLMDKLAAMLRANPGCGKVGPGLRIDDLPSDSGWGINGGGIRQNESPYWTKRHSSEAFFAPIDTTFAMYEVDRNSEGKQGFECMTGNSVNPRNLRMDFPYVFRHMPWYMTSPLSEEELYYRTHCNPKWSHSTV